MAANPTSLLATSTPNVEISRLKRWTVEEYRTMFESDRPGTPETELIFGVIYEKMAKSPKHTSLVNTIKDNFNLLFPKQYNVRAEGPIIFPNIDSQPEPDIAVCRRKPYLKDHPTAADTLLIIEVALSSYRYDKNQKLPNYAAAEIPEYWILDLKREKLEIYFDPSASTESYREQVDFPWGATIQSPTFGDQKWGDLFDF